MSMRRIVRGDIDGFFGLFIDNLVQLVMMVALCTEICGIPNEIILGRILPGAAVSILVGNLFYAWQARRLMKQTGRSDVTALPYGINTPSLIAYIFLIMGPVYRETGDSTLAWQMGLFACLVSGLMETGGAFIADWLRRNTPRAALLSALAGIAITFISMPFVFQIFSNPVIALLPTMVILIAYASRTKMPFGLPGGLFALLVGVVLAWGLRLLGLELFEPSDGKAAVQLYFPSLYLGDLFAFLSDPRGWKYMGIIVPMGLFNIIGSLQNLESAEAAGDRYETRPSLLANGIGSIVAAAFGSAFPTTIYIGHPGWKALGARAAYSTMNGVVIVALTLFGGIALIQQYVPIEAVIGILLWVGMIIMAQSFQDVPKKHAPAVALGLTPSLAAWALFLIEAALRAGGTSLFNAANALIVDDGIFIHGTIALNQGFIASSMILSAALAFVINRQYLKAAAWTAAGGILSMVGVIHAYELTELGIVNQFGWKAAPEFGAAYFLTAALLLWMHYFRRPPAEEQTDETTAQEPTSER